MAQGTEKVISITLYKLFDCSWVKSVKQVVVGLKQVILISWGKPFKNYS